MILTTDYYSQPNAVDYRSDVTLRLKNPDCYAVITEGNYTIYAASEGSSESLAQGGINLPSDQDHELCLDCNGNKYDFKINGITKVKGEL